MNNEKLNLAAGTGGSVIIDKCQICSSEQLEKVLFLGYMPPVNQMRKIGTVPFEQASYPSLLLYCRECELVQIGLSVDPAIIFPPEYPYTSGTTRILRENFADLYTKTNALLNLNSEDLIIDIGSNDGTLLSNFKQGGHKVLGIEPTDVGSIARENGIETIQKYFKPDTAAEVYKKYGNAKLVTAANCFAHIEDVHSIVEGITKLIGDSGVFVSENHYLIPLLDTLQYDTIYHEHLRYYSLTSITKLLNMHDLEVFHAERIPTHGGSIRVYSAKKGKYDIQPSVSEIRSEEPIGEEMSERLQSFKKDVVLSKLNLHVLLKDIKESNKRICGISAPSRASTLINYLGIDDGILDFVAEIKGSLKIGKYLPGTLIPVVEESTMFENQPEYALILSWHIADELAKKLREKGFKGKFIVPLPEPRII